MNKELFFAAVPPPKTETVRVGDQTLTIRAMNVGERIDFEAAAKGKASTEVGLLAIVASVVDGDGALVFTADDVPRLKTMPPDYALALMRATLKINALTDADVGDLAKNSEASP